MTVRKCREDYLEAILVLHGDASPVRSVDVARYLKVSKAAVSVMMNTLIADGYVEKLPKPPYTLSLTESGKNVAEQTWTRHCFFRDLLTQCGVDREVSEREACEMEHAISPESFLLLREALLPHMAPAGSE